MQNEKPNTLSSAITENYEKGKAVLNALAAALTCFTWASICLVSVLMIWRPNWIQVDDYGQAAWLIIMTLNVIITAVAVATTFAGFWALWQIANGALKYISSHKYAAIAFAVSALHTPIIWSLMAFTGLAVFVLALPIAAALGILPERS